MNFEVPKTMKGAEMLGHGGAEMLGYREDIAVPQIEPNEVLIKVMGRWREQYRHQHANRLVCKK